MNNYNDNCPICLEKISINDNNIIDTECCNKIFHNDCLADWYNVSQTCPLCRHDNGDDLFDLFRAARRKYIEWGVDEHIICFRSFLQIILSKMSNCNDNEDLQLKLKYLDDILRMIMVLFS